MLSGSMLSLEEIAQQSLCKEDSQVKSSRSLRVDVHKGGETHVHKGEEERDRVE